MRVFLDADVLVSACYSDKGASYAVLKNTKVDLVSSDTCLLETERALQRLDKEVNRELIDKVEIVRIDRIESDNFLKYVKDPFDVYVVAGAVKAKANILSTFNQKHYLKEEITEGLGILVYRPGELLFYIRNILL